MKNVPAMEPLEIPSSYSFEDCPIPRVVGTCRQRKRFGVVRFRQVKITAQCGNLVGDCRRRFAVRRNLADPSVERLGQVSPAKELSLGLAVEGLGCDPAIQPRQIVGSLQ
jgi:hypothetical protein